MESTHQREPGGKETREMTPGLSPALMSEEDDLERLPAPTSGVFRWLRTHAAPHAPVHRYAGIMTVTDTSLIFRGTDLKEHWDYRKTIPLHTISRVSVGLNGHPELSHDGAFVAGEPRPLVVSYRQNGHEHTSYFITNFPGLSRRVDGNRHWQDVLRRKATTARIDHARLQEDTVSDTASLESDREQTRDLVLSR